MALVGLIERSFVALSVSTERVSRHILEMATETQQENQNKVDEKSIYSQDELPDLLPVYYKRLFPYGLYYRWLNYGGGEWKHILNAVSKINSC